MEARDLPAGDARADALDASLEAELDALDREMPRIQSTAKHVFDLATQWAERHAAILQRTPHAQRDAMQARLHRMGIRWGVVPGARMTAQFPALGLPPKRIVLGDEEAA
jgi:hypothetical protein